MILDFKGMQLRNFTKSISISMLFDINGKNTIINLMLGGLFQT